MTPYSPWHHGPLLIIVLIIVPALTQPSKGRRDVSSMAHVTHEVVDVTNGVLALLHGGVEQVSHRLLLQRRDRPPGEQGDGSALRPRDAGREPLSFGVCLVLQRCPPLQAVLAVADEFL